MLPRNLPQHGRAILLGIEDEDQVRQLLATTELEIIGIESRPEQLDSLRRKRWPDNRVHLIQADPATIQLPPYLANLILISSPVELSAEQFRHCYLALRPFGGQMLGHATELPRIANQEKPERASIDSSEGWGIVTRESAPIGSSNYTGDWALSEDELVKAPFGLLWFGDAVTHFKRSPQPKFIDGVMISNPKDWTDASTREGKIDYRLLETEFTDVYTGRRFSDEEIPELRQSFSEVDRKTIQPSQYRPPQQKDDWKPEAPKAGERVNPLTGETEPRIFPKSYGCDGGFDYGLLYSMRSGTPALYDKRTESGTINISGPRSGCTNSIVPANGVLNLPFFYEGCTCSYPLPMSLALVHMPETFEQWASWGNVSADSIDGKIQRIGLNFGAPGDRTTDDGTLWLDVPNVGGPSPEIAVATEPPLEELRTFYRHSLFVEKGGAGWPWVAGSGVRGIRSVTISGLRPGDYRLRLTFCVPDKKTFDSPGKLSISTGGKDIPITLEANPHAATTAELPVVTAAADGRLTLKLSSTDGDTYLNGIEVVHSSLPLTPLPKW